MVGARCIGLTQPDSILTRFNGFNFERRLELQSIRKRHLRKFLGSDSETLPNRALTKMTFANAAKLPKNLLRPTIKPDETRSDQTTRN